MLHPRLVSMVLLAGTLGLGAAQADDIQRGPTETDAVFAARALHLPADSDLHVVAANWNGVPTLFVDYTTAGDAPERPVVAFQRQPSGAYRFLRVTVGEQEGATPDIAAIGFANADKDPQTELIVILAWPQEHYDVSGTLYEVRIFDDPKPGHPALDLLKISAHFGSECDCARRDGTSTHDRFKTIAAVKAELRKLGY